MFFLYKEGVYWHGVWWIGENEEEGRKRADEAANGDVDDYHRWVLCKFNPNCHKTDSGFQYDPEHEAVYVGRRDAQLS